MPGFVLPPESEEQISAGLYIWECGINEETDGTQHTIISSNVFDRLEDGVRVIDWIYDATNGDISSHGLSHLTNLR